MVVRRVLSALAPAAVLAAALGCSWRKPTEPEPWLMLRWVRYVRPEPAVEKCKEPLYRDWRVKVDVAPYNPALVIPPLRGRWYPPDRWRLGKRDVFWWDLNRQFAPNVWHKWFVSKIQGCTVRCRGGIRTRPCPWKRSL